MNGAGSLTCLSVRLSVCLFVCPHVGLSATTFPQYSSHRVIMEISGFITIDKGDGGALFFQGHPSNFKVTRAKILSLILSWRLVFKVTRPVAAIKSLRFVLFAYQIWMAQSKFHNYRLHRGGTFFAQNMEQYVELNKPGFWWSFLP